MTTRIHIVNFGPQAVEATPVGPNYVPVKLYSQQSTDFYVYDGQDVLVKEIPVEKIQIPSAAPKDI